MEGKNLWLVNDNLTSKSISDSQHFSKNYPESTSGQGNEALQEMLQLGIRQFDDKNPDCHDLWNNEKSEVDKKKA